MKTKKDYDNAKNLLNSDKLFNAANSLFHRKKEALALNKLADAAKIIEEGHFVCEMLKSKQIPVINIGIIKAPVFLICL